MKWLFLLFVPQVLFAKSFVIYTNQAEQKKAKELKHYLLNNPPLSYFDVTIDIQSLTDKELKCQSSAHLKRLVYCNTHDLKKKAAKDGYDQALAVADLDFYGGSGGNGVPVMTSAPKSPVQMMLHEYLHILGFADEYFYDNEETASLYCNNNYLGSVLNFAYIVPSEEGYSDDGQAKRVHASDIEWFNQIESETPITNSNLLGTPAEFMDKTGLFPSKTCDILERRRGKIWKPNGSPTIMEDLREDLGALEAMALKSLESIGFQRKQVTLEESAKCDMPPQEQLMPLDTDNQQSIEKLEQGLMNN